MRGSIGASENMRIRKKRKREIPLLVQGRIGVKKYYRGQEQPLESKVVHNSITAPGFDLLLNLIAGQSGAHFIQPRASLDIGGKQFSGATFGPSFNGTTTHPIAKTIVWEFHDDSLSTYAATTAKLYNGTFTGGITEQTEDGSPKVQLNSVDVTSFGSKNSDENWHITVEVELYSTDTDISSAGLLRMLNAIGISDDRYHFSAANTLLRPTDSLDAELGTTDIAADSASVDTANNKLMWTFTAPNNSYNGTWAKTKIKHNASGSLVDFRFGGCHADGTSCGTKGSGEEWEYTYEFTLSQG